jgi:peptidoglycan/LPS O-acetylase OafA/YrhL
MTNNFNNNENKQNITYRPDIDGLRAIAILLVIIFHAFPKFLRGGFIGVDIFFVISGYLITSIIIKDQSNDNFNLLHFYKRRIKRIFPSLIIVLIFCIVAGWFVLLSNEYELLGKHIFASSIYISNFILQSEAGYFDTDSELKPLLHLWSLAIEEQFYLIFPLFLILGKRFYINSIYIILICLVFSFLANVTQINDKPTEVFYFPIFRSWELLVGSLIAYLSFHSVAKEQSEKFKNQLSWIGFILILIAWIFFNSKSMQFPSWWAIMPTVGASCLIYPGEKSWFNRKILSSKFLIFIGLISYPLYLWHWVFLSFIRITEIEKPSVLIRILALVISIIFAWLTYFFIEKKIRFTKSNFSTAGLLFSLLLIGLMGYITKINNGFPDRAVLKKITNQDIYYNKKIFTANKQINKSCLIKYEGLFELSLKEGFCLLQDDDKLPTTLLMGDSHANHLYTGLVNASFIGGNLFNIGIGGCGLSNENLPKKCKVIDNKVLELAISTQSIKNIIISSKSFNEDRDNKKTSLFTKSKLVDNETLYSIFKNELSNKLQHLIDAKKHVIFILDIPDLEFQPSACINRPWRLTGDLVKNPCAIPREKVDERRQKYLAVVTEILKKFPLVEIWDTLPAFCDKNYCWANRDNLILYRDSHHLNEDGSVYLGNYLIEHYQKMN